MPGFKGGIDSLMNFIQRNLHYPQWEREHKIEGTVHVKFIVDKKGKVKDAKITKSVAGSRNMDASVLRIINSMPDWIPGKDNGDAVNVEFHLPILFKL